MKKKYHCFNIVKLHGIFNKFYKKIVHLHKDMIMNQFYIHGLCKFKNIQGINKLYMISIIIQRE
jgi:hypothetical protein